MFLIIIPPAHCLLFTLSSLVCPQCHCIQGPQWASISNCLVSVFSVSLLGLYLVSQKSDTLYYLFYPQQKRKRKDSKTFCRTYSSLSAFFSSFVEYSSVSIWVTCGTHQPFNPGVSLVELNSSSTTFFIYLTDSQREALAKMIELFHVFLLLYLVPNMCVPPRRKSNCLTPSCLNKN